jgi:hypothetical protein
MQFQYINNMKYKILFSILPVLFAIAMSSCEKDIEIDIPRPDAKYVIEGWIENGKPAIVIITKSAPYFDPIDSATLANSLVMGATVTVSDGISTETLGLGLNPEYYPYIMYMGSTIIGQVGKTYSLSVTIDTNVFTATTTILNPVSFDSVWFKVEPNKDTLGYIWANCTDNGATEDFYRVFTKRKGKDIGFVPMYGSTWSDKYFNGQQFTISIYRGEASFLVDFSDSEKDEFTYFKVGDTVITKLTHFEESVYNFWSAAESEIFSGGNPFSTPAVIPTNIQGGALGVWSGYSSTYDTIVAN